MYGFGDICVLCTQQSICEAVTSTYGPRSRLMVSNPWTHDCFKQPFGWNNDQARRVIERYARGNIYMIFPHDHLTPIAFAM